VAVFACAFGQQQDSVVQFSGNVLTIEDDELIPVPLTNILIENSGRGTFSGWDDGFFSLVAKMGDVIVFSAIGFETVRFQIPDTLTTNRYTIYQLLSRDTINLPETVVYPWPSREHFKIEFLALDVPEDLQDRAEANLAAATLGRLRKNLPADGVETSSFYLRKQADSYYSFGQTKPMNILNPLAWAKFFKAWKSGDFKKKPDTSNPR
jgi:hypothetical protein